jgi:5-methylcytosine-specific restriction endonuclease McrA
MLGLWRSTGLRTGPSQLDSWDGSSPPLPRLRAADRVGESLSGVPTATPPRATLAGDPEQVFRRYGRVCVHCGAPAVDVDHIIPINAGGDDSLANLRPACTRCNRSWR